MTSLTQQMKLMLVMREEERERGRERGREGGGRRS